MARLKFSLAVLLLSGTTPASADMLTWTNWTSSTAPVYGATPAGVPGTASGTMGGITVSYSGTILFAQINETAPPFGANYWISNTPDPFAGVPNGPSSNPDIIVLTGGDPTVNTITFSTPVLNPIMAVNSIGSKNIVQTYDFNQPFTILSYGNGYSGWSGPGSLTQVGNDLIGQEGTGAIQFSGLVSSISWTVPSFEYWSGFTVGSEVAETPEPASITLLVSGFAAVVGFQIVRGRRKITAANADVSIG